MKSNFLFHKNANLKHSVKVANNKEAIKNILKEASYTTLAQVLYKVIITPYLILRVFLTICILTSISLASYLVIQSFLTFFNYGVVTTSRTVFEMPTLFPKVTFCNVNRVTTEYGYNLTSILNITDSKRIYGISDEEKRKLSHDLSDILLECWFNDVPCNLTDFTWTYHQTYGNCYKFNTGFDSNGNKIDFKKSTLAGPDHGLQLTLYVNIYEKLLKNPNVYALGGVIQIGNSSYSKYHSNNGVFVSPDTNTYVSVEREFKSVLPKPYSSCEIDSNSAKFRENSEFYNLIGRSNYEYTQQLCFSQCLQKQFIDKYNCTLYYLLSFYNKIHCDSETTFLIYSKEDSFDINRECLSLCPLECYQTEYKTSYSSNRLNANDYYTDLIKTNSNLTTDFIDRSLDEKSVRESILNVYIYYTSLSYTQMTEKPQMDIFFVAFVYRWKFGSFSRTKSTKPMRNYSSGH